MNILMTFLLRYLNISKQNVHAHDHNKVDDVWNVIEHVIEGAVRKVHTNDDEHLEEVIDTK